MNYSEIKWKIQFTCGYWTEQFQTIGAYWGSSRPISSSLLPGYFVPTSLRASISLHGNNLLVTLLLLLLLSHSVMSDSVWPHRRQPTRLLRPWDSPGKNTGVGCHFLLQCMKVKSESEVAQSRLTPSDPMDCSIPGSSVHRIFPSKSTGVGCHCLLWLVTLPLLKLSHEHLDRWEWIFTQLISICLRWRRPGFDPPVGKIPWRRGWLPTPVFLPGDSHGQRSLAGYSP